MMRNALCGFTLPMFLLSLGGKEDLTGDGEGIWNTLQQNGISRTSLENPTNFEAYKHNFKPILTVFVG